MITAGAICLIVGALLSVRHRVFVLIPLSVILIIFVSLAKISAGHVFVSSFLSGIFVACGVQCGYLLALLFGPVVSSSAAYDWASSIGKSFWQRRL